MAAEVEAVLACYADAVITAGASTNAETTIEAAVDAQCAVEADGTTVAAMAAIPRLTLLPSGPCQTEPRGPLCGARPGG